jgi:hypothetical protein
MGPLHLELAGLDLGDVENAADQRQQVLGSFVDIAGIFPDPLRIFGGFDAAASRKSR